LTLEDCGLTLVFRETCCFRLQGDNNIKVDAEAAAWT